MLISTEGRPFSSLCWKSATQARMNELCMSWHLRSCIPIPLEVALAKRTPSPYIQPLADSSASAGHGQPEGLGAPKKACFVDICGVNKLPKTKDEIQRLIMAELRRFADCETACGVVVVPVVDDRGGATWTVSCFHRGGSDAYACDRALQRIVPHYQRLCDLVQKH